MDVNEFTDAAELGKGAAKYIGEMAAKNIAQKGYFTLALSGGTSPNTTFAALADVDIDWQKVFIFWSDERFVTHVDERSNYRAAYELFLSKIKIPDMNVYRAPVEIASVEEAAKVYEGFLRSVFKAVGKVDTATGFPIFDLICLGIGADGHTASIFPKSPAITEKKKWVLNVKAPEGAEVEERITFTIPVINNADNVMFIVSGANKGNVINELLAGKSTLPASFVKPKGKLEWFINKAAY